MFSTTKQRSTGCLLDAYSGTDSRPVCEELGPRPARAPVDTIKANALPPRATKDARPTEDRNLFTPPVTPVKGDDSSNNVVGSVCATLGFDFANIDYELERANVLGSGLWSKVYLAKRTTSTQLISSHALHTPPSTPQKQLHDPLPLIFAVKVASRADADLVFRQEARILTSLMRSAESSRYIVPFYGYDPRKSALVFEARTDGTLEDFSKILAAMTNDARQLKLRECLPSLAKDLISGLDFIHAAEVVHADIKPANILLEHEDITGSNRALISARYIDFSASFFAEEGDVNSNAGGTWEFMAPEQMSTKAEFSTPTFASDVWSLAITLLSVVIGGSPYSRFCGGNKFMLREAIKSGEALRFATENERSSITSALPFDVKASLGPALRKDRGKRVTAAVWKDCVNGHVSVSIPAL